MPDPIDETKLKAAFLPFTEVGTKLSTVINKTDKGVETSRSSKMLLPYETHGMHSSLSLQETDAIFRTAAARAGVKLGFPPEMVKADKDDPLGTSFLQYSISAVKSEDSKLSPKQLMDKFDAQVQKLTDEIYTTHNNPKSSADIQKFIDSANEIFTKNEKRDQKSELDVQPDVKPAPVMKVSL